MIFLYLNLVGCPYLTLVIDVLRVRHLIGGRSEREFWREIAKALLREAARRRRVAGGGQPIVTTRRGSLRRAGGDAGCC